MLLGAQPHCRRGGPQPWGRPLGRRVRTEGCALETECYARMAHVIGQAGIFDVASLSWHQTPDNPARTHPRAVSSNCRAWPSKIARRRPGALATDHPAAQTVDVPHPRVAFDEPRARQVPTSKIR